MSTTATQQMIALEGRGLTKVFGGVAALNNVDVQFPTGSVTAVMGDNGAGKSTLMKILSGVHPADSGILEVNGHAQVFRSPSDARDAGIETVHQDLSLADHRDIAANLFLGRELTTGWGPFRRLAIKRMREEALESLTALGVDIPSVAAEVRHLSGGQRQAIAIARAVHFGCSILIMDEPMAALGLREAQKVQNLITDLASRGITQIIVSHNLDHTFAVANRIIVFRQGRVAGVHDTSTASPSDVLHTINGLD
ncbi:MAG: sugar ABC transporter ATP-binding protein [Microcella sp.]|uniref:ATP-binding cassette domain-containing protein n=1 Tax=Microcella sp. TaxID=1913979 RepID=UPI0024CD136D|nr:ATP-binding cassette domain-containing protein [Microcella sp.]UYN83853.1 MAG: sugar ABC transporter ATP-binding protein [Microcella sp.]